MTNPGSDKGGENDRSFVESLNTLFQKPPQLIPLPDDHESADSFHYSIAGDLRIPHAGNRNCIPIKGVLHCRKSGEKHQICFESDIVTAPECWNLVENVSISGGSLRIEWFEGRPVVRMRGVVQYSDGKEFETGGVIDAVVHHDTEDPDRLYIGTLLTDAWVRNGPEFHSSGATVRFEACTKKHVGGMPLPYSIDEMEEYLFQCEQPVPIAAFHLTGTQEQPFTMSVAVNALDPCCNTRASLEIFPVRLQLPALGENSVIFIGGSDVDLPFTVEVSGHWTASVSSSPILHLVSAAEPSGPTLVQGGALLIGKIAGEGLHSAELTACSEFTNAVAFPQSRWAQPIPDQLLSLTISSKGILHVVIVFGALRIDGKKLFCAGEADARLHATLHENGLVFKSGYFIELEDSSRPPGVLPSFIIDNHCRILVEVGGELVGIEKWLAG